MIGPQGKLRVVPSLSYNLQKFIGSSLFVHFEESVLVFAYITRNTQYSYMSLRLDIITRILVIKCKPGQDVKRSD